MSSDNGIYILRTVSKDGNGFEYRVLECGAIDNIYYYDDTGDLLEMWNYFHGCEVFTNHDRAFEEAIKIEQEYGYTEYGICWEEVDKVFPPQKPICPEHELKEYRSDDICMRCNEKVEDY